MSPRRNASGGASSLASWRRFVERDIEPIAKLPIDGVGLTEIKRAVTPFVDAGLLDTARGVQARMQALLDYAGEHGWRPEDRRSRFSQIAPRPRKGDEPNHHPALMPDRDADAIRAVVARLRASPSMSALALEFVILTAVRVSEATGATWDEIDLDKALWNIRGPRMKMRRPHVVPLSDRAMRILVALHEFPEIGKSTSSPAPGRAGIWCATASMTKLEGSATAGRRRMAGDRPSAHGAPRQALRSRSPNSALRTPRRRSSHPMIGWR